MIQNMREDHQLVMLVALETGLRISDVLSLTYAGALGWEPITERKTKKTCTIDLPRFLKDALIARMTRKPFESSDLVFQSSRDSSKPIARSTIYRAVRNAADEAGFDAHVTPHTARKIFAVEALRLTGDLDGVRKLLRHDYLSTTLLYALSDKLQHFSESCN